MSMAGVPVQVDGLNEDEEELATRKVSSYKWSSRTNSRTIWVWYGKICQENVGGENCRVAVVLLLILSTGLVIMWWNHLSQPETNGCFPSPSHFLCKGFQAGAILEQPELFLLTGASR